MSSRYDSTAKAMNSFITLVELFRQGFFNVASLDVPVPPPDDTGLFRGARAAGLVRPDIDLLDAYNCRDVRVG